MAFGIRKPNVSPIAVDFGVSTLKVIQIEPGARPSLVAAASLETPYHLLHDDDQRFAFQTESLPKLIRGAGFQGRRAVCSVSSLRTLVQSVQIQRTQGVAATDLVNEQIRQISGRDPASLIIRQCEVCEVNRAGQKRTEVICFAMPRDIVINHMKALRASKLDPVGIHCEHIAALRSFIALAGKKADNATLSLYLDLGYGSTNVVVARGDKPLLAKTVHIAGRALDHELAQQWGCPIVEARQRRLAAPQESSVHTTDIHEPSEAAGEAQGLARMRAGVPTDTAHGPSLSAAVADASPQGEPDGDPTAILRGAESAHLDALAEEIRMCLRYFNALFPSEKIERIIFLGGESRNLEMCKTIARGLRLPAQIADPLTPLEKPKSEKRISGVDVSVPQPGWAVPLGLTAARTDL